MRPVDQELFAIEKTACYAEFLEEGACHAPMGPHRKAPGLVRRQREQGNETGTFTVVSMVSMGSNG